MQFTHVLQPKGAHLGRPTDAQEPLVPQADGGQDRFQAFMEGEREMGMASESVDRDLQSPEEMFLSAATGVMRTDPQAVNIVMQTGVQSVKTEGESASAIMKSGQAPVDLAGGAPASILDSDAQHIEAHKVPNIGADLASDTVFMMPVATQSTVLMQDDDTRMQTAEGLLSTENRSDAPKRLDAKIIATSETFPMEAVKDVVQKSADVAPTEQRSVTPLSRSDFAPVKTTEHSTASLNTLDPAGEIPSKKGAPSPDRVSVEMSSKGTYGAGLSPNLTPPQITTPSQTAPLASGPYDTSAFVAPTPQDNAPNQTRAQVAAPPDISVPSGDFTRSVPVGDANVSTQINDERAQSPAPVQNAPKMAMPPHTPTPPSLILPAKGGEATPKRMEAGAVMGEVTEGVPEGPVRDAVSETAVQSRTVPTAAEHSKTLYAGMAEAATPLLFAEGKAQAHDFSMTSFYGGVDGMMSQLDQLSQADPLTQTSRVELPARLAAQIADVARQLPDGPIEISLSPEELGKVKLTFQVSENGAMNVVIAAERADTLEFMKRNADSLLAEFSDLGYEGSSFQFEQENHNPSDDGSESKGSPQSDGSKDNLFSEKASKPDTHAPARLHLDGTSGMDIKL